MTRFFRSTVTGPHACGLEFGKAHTANLRANIARAAQLLASADVSASSSINLVSYEDGGSAAMTVELHPGGPCTHRKASAA